MTEAQPLGSTAPASGRAPLHDRDLVPALRAQLAPYADSFPVTLTTHPDPLPPLDEQAAATAYLVVGEAVRNAARHSGGTGASVSLRVAGDRLLAEVRDDGHGLGPAPAGQGRTGSVGPIGTGVLALGLGLVALGQLRAAARQS